MPSADDALSRLVAAEHAAFHRGPQDALAVTGPAMRSAAAAAAAGLPCDAALVAWCHAVSLGAAGRYGSALALLAGTPSDGAGARLQSLRASLLRQLGRHGDAQVLDAGVLADPAAEPVGRADAAVGLVADAIGVADVAAAAAALRRVDQLTAAGPGPVGAWTPHGWRVVVRREWVACELALLVEDPAQAAEHAGRAARLAADERAERHLAKSRLLLGVATRDPAAVRGCLDWARATGCLSLRWPAALVLAHLPDGAGARAADESRALLVEAAAGVRAIADGLAATDRAGWLARPEVAALLTDGGDAAGGPAGGAG